MLRRLAVSAAAAVVISVAVIIATSLPTSPADREENERILEALPLYPGAELLGISSSPYYGCEWPFPRRQGFVTAATYRARSSATAEDIVEFYIARLQADWQASREDIGIMSIGEPGRPGESLGSIPMARFVKGTASVHVSTENMVKVPGSNPAAPTPAYDFAVAIDSEGTVERPYCD